MRSTPPTSSDVDLPQSWGKVPGTAYGYRRFDLDVFAAGWVVWGAIGLGRRWL
jgi:hypothetical protein